jgi:hypothetical protein
MIKLSHEIVGALVLRYQPMEIAIPEGLPVDFHEIVFLDMEILDHTLLQTIVHSPVKEKCAPVIQHTYSEQFMLTFKIHFLTIYPSPSPLPIVHSI